MAQENYVAPSILASSAAFSDLQAGGITGVLNLVIAANPAITNPSVQATVAATGGGTTGGNLPAGTYYLSYTFSDGAGETLIGSSRSASFTIAAGNIPQATLPAVPAGACGINVYLTAAGGAAGTEVIYATGITATAFNLSFAGPNDATATIPTANTTGAAALAGVLRVGGKGGMELLWTRLSDMVSHFVSGQPVPFQAARLNVRQVDYAFALWKQATKEVLALIAANPGAIKYRATLVQAQPYRSWS